jgi:hypothetical protein
MEILSRVFVQQPLHILLVAVVCLLAWGLARRAPGERSRHGNSLRVAAIAWLYYAVWEWLVVTMTPEANIPVDLLIIWPILIILTPWSIFRTGRSWVAGLHDECE